MADAEASRAEVDAGIADDQKHTMVLRVSKDGKLADAVGADYYKFSFDEVEIAKMIPDIDIREIRGKCNESGLVTTNVEGFDGQNKSRVRIVMCGKGQGNIARQHAIQGLREALDEIKSDGEMPKSVRKDVVKNLEKEIEKLKKQMKDDSEASGDA